MDSWDILEAAGDPTGYFVLRHGIGNCRRVCSHFHLSRRIVRPSYEVCRRVLDRRIIRSGVCGGERSSDVRSPGLRKGIMAGHSYGAIHDFIILLRSSGSRLGSEASLGISDSHHQCPFHFYTDSRSLWKVSRSFSRIPGTTTSSRHFANSWSRFPVAAEPRFIGFVATLESPGMNSLMTSVRSPQQLFSTLEAQSTSPSSRCLLVTTSSIV